MEWIQGSISRQEEIGLIVIYMAESDMRKSIILVMVDTKNEMRSAFFRVLRWLIEISSGPLISIAKRKKLPTFRFYLMIDAHRTVGLQVKSHQQDHERNDRKG